MLDFPGEQSTCLSTRRRHVEKLCISPLQLAQVAECRYDLWVVPWHVSLTVTIFIILYERAIIYFSHSSILTILMALTKVKQKHNKLFSWVYIYICNYNLFAFQPSIWSIPEIPSLLPEFDDRFHEFHQFRTAWLKWDSAGKKWSTDVGFAWDCWGFKRWLTEMLWNALLQLYGIMDYNHHDIGLICNCY